MNVSFVAADPDALDAISTMARDIWLRHYHPDVLTLDEIEYFWHRMYRPEILRTDMERGAVYEKILVGGTMVGFLSYVLDATGTVSDRAPEHRRMRLAKLYLLPEWHGQGLGAQALRYVQARAHRLGVDQIDLYVFRKNTQAVRAYLRAGFIIAREEKSYTEDGYCYDDYVMTWEVPDV